jgi:dihydrolipoamide dehydrogenase
VRQQDAGVAPAPKGDKMTESVCAEESPVSEQSASTVHDIVILGGGSGGYACALRAAQLGLDVVLVEEGKLGGTCLHQGCIPTKALLHSAEVADAAREGQQFGVKSTFDGIDMTAVNAYKDGVVSRLFKGLTGSTHRSLPGLEVDGSRVITSDHALTLDYVPRSVVVLGGGVIGVEFASVWKSFGAEVTVVEALPHLLPLEDEDLSKQIERQFRKRGIAQELGARFASVAESATGVVVHLENGKTIDADLLLVAVGRGPVSSGLGFEEVGVAMDRGFVTVDEYCRTSVPNVYAVGDLIPTLQLAHVGFAEGILVAEHVAGLDPRPIDYDGVPRVTYSEPEVASVGLTEAAAREKYGDTVTTVKYDLGGNGKSQILKTAGVVKLVAVKDGPVVGVHIIGSRAGELLAEGQLIYNWEAYADDVASLIHAHPTQSEAMGEAHLALAGKPLHAHS